MHSLTRPRLNQVPDLLAMAFAGGALFGQQRHVRLLADLAANVDQVGHLSRSLLPRPENVGAHVVAVYPVFQKQRLKPDNVLGWDAIPLGHGLCVLQASGAGDLGHPDAAN